MDVVEFNLPLFLFGSALAQFNQLAQFSLNKPLTSVKELELNSDQKVIVACLNEKLSETFQELTLIIIMPV